jgi:hypothetical protein
MPSSSAYFMTNCNGRSVNSDNCNAMDAINPISYHLVHILSCTAFDKSYLYAVFLVCGILPFMLN